MRINADHLIIVLVCQVFKCKGIYVDNIGNGNVYRDARLESLQKLLMVF